MNNEIYFTLTIDGVDWDDLKDALAADDFDNGRTVEQLKRSFANSQCVCFAWADGKVVGKGRVLSDGVGNAYLLDLWTHSACRDHGIATRILTMLLEELPGQHVYLQADEELVGFYLTRGFHRQPHGMSRIMGQYLADLDSVEQPE